MTFPCASASSFNPSTPATTATSATRCAAVRTSASTSPSTGTTSTRSTATPTARTSSAGPCWAWAEQTSRIEIGALVSCNSYRNPELLADMARTVDHISGGPADPRYRVGLDAEGLRRVRLRIRHGRKQTRRSRRSASRIEARLAKLNLAPTRRIPILIGGGAAKTLRLVAKHADIWHGFTNAETYPGKAAVLDGHCEAVGRDASTVERSAGVEGRDTDTSSPTPQRWSTSGDAADRRLRRPLNTTWVRPRR